VNRPRLKLLLLSAFLCFAPARASGGADSNQNWIEIRSDHFTVATNASEKDGRRIVEQFEQMRAMFHAAFATFRVDPAQPIYILAAKNEATLKTLLPDEWAVKGHIHHAGMYVHGGDKDYVLLELDAQGENPYRVVYHEYTHVLSHLNFSGLPLWLDEGLADFFGNTTLGEKQSETGTIDVGTLQYLQQHQFIPIETLLQVDHTSPYYNESNRASMFYAESWALVHYLMMSPDARRQQLMYKFIAAWDKNQDQVAAAQATFGDLKRFGSAIEAYSRQQRFMVGVVKMQASEANKNYAVRRLSEAEALARQGDAFAHRDRLEEANPLLEQAVKLDPQLAIARQGLGFYYFRKGEFEKADAQIKEGIARGDTSFEAAYFHGMLLVGYAPFAVNYEEAAESLRKATKLNPQFAPAFDMLAQVYSQMPGSKKQAVDAEYAAVKLNPAEHRYLFRLIDLLIGDDRDADAKYLAQRLAATANSSDEKARAEAVLSRVESHEKWMAEKKASMAAGGLGAGNGSLSGADRNAAVDPGASGKPDQSRNRPPTTMAIEGTIQDVDCGHAPEVTIKLDFSGSLIALHAANIELAQVTAAKGQSAMSGDACANWKGRKVKAWFHLNPRQGQEIFGEITKLYFY